MSIDGQGPKNAAYMNNLSTNACTSPSIDISHKKSSKPGLSSPNNKKPNYHRRIIAGHGNTVVYDMDCTCSNVKRLKNYNKMSTDDKPVSSRSTDDLMAEVVVEVDKKKTGNHATKTKVTRCVGTSPQFDLKNSRKVIKKDNLSPFKTCEPIAPQSPSKTSNSAQFQHQSQNSNRVLEKSNSLGESKPQRLLRTTRSLSPRPPVKHQTAITVSDENDVVSIKLSPNDTDLDDVFNQRRGNKLESFSERASPNLSEISVFKGSDSHLVYVPSDPWMKMSDNFRKQMDNDDPWVWRSTTNIVDEHAQLKSRREKLQRDDKVWKSAANILVNDKVAVSKQSLYRQSKSFSCKDGDEMFNGGKELKLVNNTDSAIRPTKKKTKTIPLPLPPPPPPPADFDAFNSHTDNIPSKSPRHSPYKVQVPPIPMNPPVLEAPTKRNTLNLPQNANYLQPRHSFSIPSSGKDDELPLNIRRLSEQIRNPPAFLLSTGVPAQSSDSIVSITSKQQQHAIVNFDEKRKQSAKQITGQLTNSKAKNWGGEKLIIATTSPTISTAINNQQSLTKTGNPIITNSNLNNENKKMCDPMLETTC